MRTKKTEKITELPGNSSTNLNKTGNKLAYLICIEEPDKLRFFVTSKIQKTDILDFVGYEVKQQSIKKIITYKDAVDYANKDGANLISIMYPMHRVVSIQNITYCLKISKIVKEQQNE